MLAAKSWRSVPRLLVNKKGWDLVPGLEDVESLAVWLTDFSELQCKNGRKAHFMPVLDPRVKWVPDWRWGDGGTGLEAMGLSLEGRIAHHDQDPVYTGHRRLCRLLVKGKARVSYSEHGAKGTR